jgi:hypothetical protein
MLIVSYRSTPYQFRLSSTFALFSLTVRLLCLDRLSLTAAVFSRQYTHVSPFNYLIVQYAEAHNTMGGVSGAAQRAPFNDWRRCPDSTTAIPTKQEILNTRPAADQ